MPLDRFSEQVRSAGELASIVGTPSALAVKKELGALDEHMRQFIALSPFVVISTHSADGRCDASPRGDAPGFVQVVGFAMHSTAQRNQRFSPPPCPTGKGLTARRCHFATQSRLFSGMRCKAQVVDERTLLIPDRRGNKRVDSFRNIIETGAVGLLFLVPGIGETLRVNGRAAIVRDEAWLTPLVAQGKRPLLAVAVEVQECFLQCAKALLRSNLWAPHEAPGLQNLPCAAQMFADQVQLPEYDVAAMQALLDDAYRNNLY